MLNKIADGIYLVPTETAMQLNLKLHIETDNKNNWLMTINRIILDVNKIHIRTYFS